MEAMLLSSLTFVERNKNYYFSFESYKVVEHTENYIKHNIF